MALFLLEQPNLSHDHPVGSCYVSGQKCAKMVVLFDVCIACCLYVWRFLHILMAEEGFQISQSIAYPVGIVFSLACFLLYLVKAISISKQQLRTEP